MTAAEYDRVPQVVGADYELPLARSLERIWATKPGLLGWISTVDHKEIGLRYIVTAFAFLIAGGLEALVLRVQLARPNQALLTPEQYDELFSMHGITMIFLYASPGAFGVQQLSLSPGSGREGHGVSTPQRLLLLGLSRGGALHLRELARGGRAQRRLVQLRPLCAARIQPGPEPRLLCAGNDLPRASRRRSAQRISSSPSCACGRPAWR